MSEVRPALVIGAAGQDVIGQLDGDLHPGTSNPARIRAGFGGVARNVAENLARLGQPVRLISVVGADPAGDLLLEETAAAGVDVLAVLRTSEFPTGFYMGLIGADGALVHAVDDMRAIASLTGDDLRQREDLFRESALLFVDANLPPLVLRSALSLARRAGIPVCADPVSSGLAPRLAQHLDRLHLITPNSSEAGVLTGLSFAASDRDGALEAAKILVNRGAKIALVTLAEFGVVYASSDQTGHIPAIRTRISDPTGAGDALTAAVIFGLLNDIPLDEAIRLGVSAASLTLRHAGTVCPDLSLERLYDQLLV